MSNFAFLKEGFPGIHKKTKLSESRVFTEPDSSARYNRLALEEAVHIIYDLEQLDLPYDRTLSSLLYDQEFRLIIPRSFDEPLKLVKNIGNAGAHYGKGVRGKDALISIKHLFTFLKWFANLYAEVEPTLPGAFDETIIPKVGSEKRKLREIQEEAQREQLKLQQRLDDLVEKLAQQEEAARQSKQAFEALEVQRAEEKAQLKAQKEAREIEITPEYSEAQTRVHLIDLALREAGWDDLLPGKEIEFPVKGMPITRDNPRGNGFVDYVLWDDNGLPLAIIEAKRTTVQGESGRHQAQLYADCLEKMYGQRPVIFYTNGYRTHIWDDSFYSLPRRVYGFLTKDELQWLIQRRNTRRDIRKADINQKITNRPYQIEGIQRTMESLVVNENSTGKMRGAKRSALLVMATGSGKTRTAASIVDVLFKNNWIKRVLFLADRNALVSQAKKSFGEHLPDLSSIDLTQEKENNTTRLVFSTYQTIINKIDGEKMDDARFYGVGHFDLIIVDEAHRSVYNKYGIIFEYFDAILLGLTATPKKEIDHNTFDLFDCSDGNPTFAYELEDAVQSGYLTPYRNISLSTAFLREGIRYKDLSPEDKEKYEEEFRDNATGLFPDHIRNSALNRWLFNKDTVDKILDSLMEMGLHIEGGDKLGRTIIFAANQHHADFVQECFEKRYPGHPSGFIKVVHNKKSHAQSVIEAFCDHHEEKLPQIAVSVDMMDTGIDAPRVLNLVFFKFVRSYAKFWQMIGRGTRLCPDVFGPDRPKEYFLIFDVCGNFEFFDEQKHLAETKLQKPITQQIFITRLAIAKLLLETGEDEGLEIAETLLNTLHQSINNLSRDRFQVQMELEFVDQFKDRTRWQNLDEDSIHIIEKHLSHLPPPDTSDENARRFDLTILKMMQAHLLHLDSESTYQGTVITIAEKLSKKYSIPEVRKSKVLIEAMRDPDFYDDLKLRKMEEIRREIRDLVQYLEAKEQPRSYIDIADTEVISVTGEQPLMPVSNEMYKRQVERFIREHKNHITISKLNTNQPITDAEIEELQRILFDGGERGSIDQFREVYGDQPLGVFIRSIIGLDIQAAQQLFADFLQSGDLTADQMKFIDSIIKHLTRNGTIDKSLLFKPPFTNTNDKGLLGVFDDAQVTKIVALLDGINENAEVG